MADFCRECSIELFDKDFHDLANLSTEQQTKDELYVLALCEGCGPIQVDHTGTCVTIGCLRNHNE